jgi:energy-coupling factor transporter ATP-binding protein EcfA2
MATEGQRHSLTASEQERAALWQEVPEAEQMARWEAQTNEWLASQLRDPGNPGARAFLQKLLRGSETEPLEDVEVSARALYTTFFDEAGRGESIDFVRRVLKLTTKAEREAQFDLIAVLLQIYGGESAEEALRLVRERHQATVLGTDLTTGEEVLLPYKARPHVVLVGNTGSGKSTLLKHMIADTVSISRGLGVAVIDPHDGALVNDVLGLIPERRLKDVVYLNFTDVSAPFPLNVFACEDPGSMTEAGQVASFVMHLYETLFFAGGGLAGAPQFSQIMRNSSRVMIEQGLTMAEIPLLLTDDTVRERLTATLRNPQVKLFWEEYNRRNARARTELTASTANKLDAFLSDPLVRNIVSQRQTIPWRRLMDERAIILITLSRQQEQASQLVGATILGQLLMASFSRMGAASCPEFHVFADEWQNLVTSDVATWIHEARKGHCVLHLANQSLSQLSPVNQQAALSAGALVVFRVGAGEDAKTLAQSLDHTPAPEIRAPVSDVVGHLLRRGHSHAAVSQFITEYLRPLEAFIRKVGVYQHEFAFGCTVIHPSHLIDGQRLVNDVLVEAMRTGRGDGFIPPLALLTLGGATDERITHVFSDHIKRKALNNYVVEGFYQSANTFGRPGFRTEQALQRFLASYTKPGLLGRLFGIPRQVPDSVRAFVRLLRSLGEVQEILSQQPVLVETGESPAVYRPHSFADAAAAAANCLSQMDNYTARVKTLSGEHFIKTSPAPQGVSSEALTARLHAVKERMFERGLCRRDARDVEKEVAERHEALRGPGADRPRRRRDAEPPPPAYG